MSFKVLETAGGSDYIVCDDGRVFRVSCKACKPQLNGSGYERINMDGNLVFTHKLVARAFFGEPVGDATEVDHIDGDLKNNRVSNLRYVTRSQNMRNIHKRKEDRKTRKILTTHERCMILRDCIKHDGENGVRALARKYGVDAATIRGIVNRRTCEGQIGFDLDEAVNE